MKLKYGLIATSTTAAVVALAASMHVDAQSRTGAGQPRTAWGVPDISGVYAEYTTAPLERPPEFGDREYLTDDEFAELELDLLQGLPSMAGQDHVQFFPQQ